jgi:hypothetical protein
MSIVGDLCDEAHSRQIERIRKLYANGGSADYLRGLEDAYNCVRDDASRSGGVMSFYWKDVDGTKPSKFNGMSWEEWCERYPW